MFFRVNLKMKKPTLCCCFTWIGFIELSSTVVFLLIRKAWDDWFVSKMGGWGILRNSGDPCNGGMILKWGVGLIPLYRLCFLSDIFLYHGKSSILWNVLLPIFWQNILTSCWFWSHILNSSICCQLPVLFFRPQYHLKADSLLEFSFWLEEY